MALVSHQPVEEVGEEKKKKKKKKKEKKEEKRGDEDESRLQSFLDIFCVVSEVE